MFIRRLTTQRREGLPAVCACALTNSSRLLVWNCRDRSQLIFIVFGVIVMWSEMKWIVKFMLPCIESASASGSSTDIIGDLCLVMIPFESLLTSTFPIISYFLENHNVLHGNILSSRKHNICMVKKMLPCKMLHGNILHGKKFLRNLCYYCYFSQRKRKSQKKWAGPEELWNDKKQQQAALEHQKQRRERGIE